jgi:hypothetical protein
MKTRSDLIVAALELLQADGGAGQSPEPEDVLQIEKIIDGKLAELNRRSIYYSADGDEFDDEFVSPLAIILANEAAPKFGKPRNEDSRLGAEDLLREMRDGGWNPADVIESEYF